MPENSDKGEHFVAYFIPAGSAVQLFRRGRPLLWVGVALVLMGIGIEFAQGALTSNRMADPMDAIANTVGVLVGMVTALTRCATCCCAGEGEVPVEPSPCSAAFQPESRAWARLYSRSTPCVDPAAKRQPRLAPT